MEVQFFGDSNYIISLDKKNRLRRVSLSDLSAKQKETNGVTFVNFYHPKDQEGQESQYNSDMSLFKQGFHNGMVAMAQKSGLVTNNSGLAQAILFVSSLLFVVGFNFGTVFPGRNFKFRDQSF